MKYRLHIVCEKGAPIIREVDSDEYSIVLKELEKLTDIFISQFWMINIKSGAIVVKTSTIEKVKLEVINNYNLENKPSNNLSIGEKIKYYREKRGLTQSELAEKLGYSRAYLATVENGKNRPSKNLVDNIAVALNISKFLFC